MIDNLSRVTACVIDHGLFHGLAQELAREKGGFGRVLYHDPEWERGFPSIRDGAVGDGFDNVECCLDIWRVMDEVDLFIFPDIQHSGLQLDLERRGKLVWGPRDGDALEIDRELFLETLQKLGLDVPPFEVITGLSALRKHLAKEPDAIVKISQWRADLETFRYRDDAHSRDRLDRIASRLGPIQDEMPFLVFDPIETPIEVGYDGYFCGGKFPARSLQGPEIKDKCYLGAMREYDDLPEPVLKVNEAFAPVLAKFNYAGFWSTEIRVKGKHAYFIDPTCRAGLPSGDAQFKAYSNLPEIILYGAQGVLVDPEPAFQFVAQAMIRHADPKEGWRLMDIPESVSPWVRLLRSCKIGPSLYAICPGEDSVEEVGTVLGVGDTIDDSIAHCRDNAEAIAHNPVEVHIAAFVDALREIEAMEKRGLEFSDQEVPEAATVVEK